MECVLDTKYKRDGTPAESDVYQIVFYAQAMGCREAVLVYTASLAKTVDTCVKDIHVRTIAFALDEDLDVAESGFLGELLSGMTHSA